MMLEREPRPGDFCVLRGDVVEAVSFLQDRVVASAGQLGVVRSVERPLLLFGAARVEVVLIGTGRVVTARPEQVGVLDAFPTAGAAS